MEEQRVFERYCPVVGQRVTVCLSWDSAGARQERCLRRGACIREFGGCRSPGQLERAGFCGRGGSFS